MKVMKIKKCDICGSENSVHKIKSGKLLCLRHYSQLRLYGKILDITKYDKNTYEIRSDSFGDYAILDLRNSKMEIVSRTKIDLDDLDKCLSRKWRLEKCWGYVSSGSKKGEYVMLQNFVMNHIGLIDHKDRDTMNNRKYNLIISNKSLNSLNIGIRSNNKSGVTGVIYNKNFDLWRAYINWDGKRIELGYGRKFEDAVFLRLKKEKELLGDLSPQRKLFFEYGIE